MDIYEFSTGINIQTDGQGHWWSIGYLGGWMYNTYGSRSAYDIPYPIQQAYDNKEFAVGETNKSNFTAMGRVISLNNETWAVVAFLTYASDEKGRRVPTYRFFFTEGGSPAINEILRRVITFEMTFENRYPKYLPIFDPRGETDLNQYPPADFNEINKLIGIANTLKSEVQTSIENRTYVLQEGACLVTNSNALCLYKLNQLAIDRAVAIKETNTPSWAYNADVLQRPETFILIQASDEFAYERLSAKRSGGIVKYQAGVDEQGIRAALKGLIEYEKIDATAPTNIKFIWDEIENRNLSWDYAMSIAKELGLSDYALFKQTHPEVVKMASFYPTAFYYPPDAQENIDAEYDKWLKIRNTQWGRLFIEYTLKIKEYARQAGINDFPRGANKVNPKIVTYCFNKVKPSPNPQEVNPQKIDDLDWALYESLWATTETLTTLAKNLKSVANDTDRDILRIHEFLNQLNQRSSSKSHGTTNSQTHEWIWQNWDLYDIWEIVKPEDFQRPPDNHKSQPKKTVQNNSTLSTTTPNPQPQLSGNTGQKLLSPEKTSSIASSITSESSTESKQEKNWLQKIIYFTFQREKKTQSSAPEDAQEGENNGNAEPHNNGTRQTEQGEGTTSSLPEPSKKSEPRQNWLSKILSNVKVFLGSKNEEEKDGSSENPQDANKSQTDQSGEPVSPSHESTTATQQPKHVETANLVRSISQNPPSSASVNQQQTTGSGHTNSQPNQKTKTTTRNNSSQKNNGKKRPPRQNNNKTKSEILSLGLILILGLKKLCYFAWNFIYILIGILKSIGNIYIFLWSKKSRVIAWKEWRDSVEEYNRAKEDQPKPRLYYNQLAALLSRLKARDSRFENMSNFFELLNQAKDGTIFLSYDPQEEDIFKTLKPQSNLLGKMRHKISDAFWNFILLIPETEIWAICVVLVSVVRIICIITEKLWKIIVIAIIVIAIIIFQCQLLPICRTEPLWANLKSQIETVINDESKDKGEFARFAYSYQDKLAKPEFCDILANNSNDFKDCTNKIYSSDKNVDDPTNSSDEKKNLLPKIESQGLISRTWNNKLKSWLIERIFNLKNVPGFRKEEVEIFSSVVNRDKVIGIFKKEYSAKPYISLQNKVENNQITSKAISDLPTILSREYVNRGKYKHYEVNGEANLQKLANAKLATFSKQEGEIVDRQALAFVYAYQLSNSKLKVDLNVEKDSETFISIIRDVRKELNQEVRDKIEQSSDHKAQYNKLVENANCRFDKTEETCKNNSSVAAIATDKNTTRFALNEMLIDVEQECNLKNKDQIKVAIIKEITSVTPDFSIEKDFKYSDQRPLEVVFFDEARKIDKKDNKERKSLLSSIFDYQIGRVIYVNNQGQEIKQEQGVRAKFDSWDGIIDYSADPAPKGTYNNIKKQVVNSLCKPPVNSENG